MNKEVFQRAKEIVFEIDLLEEYKANIEAASKYDNPRMILYGGSAKVQLSNNLYDITPFLDTYIASIDHKLDSLQRELDAL